MAIGDNIPSIFSNLAQSVIKSNGDPMYLMDQFEGRDPDAEQQLRMGIMDGPPPPMEGSLLDQYLFATGDPNQATGMVINDIMARHDETVNTLEDAKIDTTASQLLNMFPEYKQSINKVGSSASVISYSTRDIDRSESIQASDIHSTLTPDGEDDDIIDYYEVYRKIKVPYINVFVMIPPSTAQLRQIKAEVDIALQELTNELRVRYLEKETMLNAQVGEGAIIPERAALEMEKEKKGIETTLIEQRRMLMSKAVEQATQTKQQSMTIKEYNILIKNDEFRESISDTVK